MGEEKLSEQGKLLGWMILFFVLIVLYYTIFRLTDYIETLPKADPQEKIYYPKD